MMIDYDQTFNRSILEPVTPLLAAAAVFLNKVTKVARLAHTTNSLSFLDHVINISSPAFVIVAVLFTMGVFGIWAFEGRGIMSLAINISLVLRILIGYSVLGPWFLFSSPILFLVRVSVAPALFRFFLPLLSPPPPRRGEELKNGNKKRFKQGRLTRERSG